MTTATYTLIFVYYIISISNILFLFTRYRICPELLWSVFQFFMFFGITQLIDNAYPSDELLLLLYVIALLSFIIGSSFARAISKPRKMIEIERRPDLYKIRSPYVWVMMIVSIVLCSIFFARAGGNVFINGIRAMISDTVYSTKYSRKGILSVSGVGYIYQFRVTIFPILVLYYALIKRKSSVTAVLVVLMFTFIVGTGQRGGLFSFLVIVLVTVYYLYTTHKAPVEAERKKQPNNRLLYISVVGISGVLFGLSTILNGRVAEGSTVFAATIKRLLNDNQSCAIKGFRYITNEPIQYGKDWLMQMIDILPGSNRYVSLDTRIFAFMHGGSTAGTSPPCIWGSAYYNFGIFGVIMLSFILGIVMAGIHAQYSKKVNDEFSIIIYSAKQFLLAYWVAAGPIVLFNSGFVAVLLLDFILTSIALKYRFVFGKVKMI